MSQASMHSHKATRKDHRCDTCGRRIPIGARYWTTESGDFREHTNCLDFETEPELPEMYNHNRSAYRKKP